MVAFGGRNEKRWFENKFYQIQKSIHIRFRVFSVEPMLGYTGEIIPVNTRYPNGYFVFVSHMVFSRVRHELERPVLPIPTQLRSVPENSIITMGTYNGRRGWLIAVVFSGILYSHLNPNLQAPINLLQSASWTQTFQYVVPYRYSWQVSQI